MTAGRVLLSWGVPVGMTGAYAVLAWSSDTDNTGKAWMAIGLGFVYVIWFVFRVLTDHAILARAVAIGDATRILERTTPRLARTTRPAARAPLLVHQASAQALRGTWEGALATLDEARLDAVPAGKRGLLVVHASAVRIEALVETGAVREARRVLDDTLAPAVAPLDRRLHGRAHLTATLGRGRVLAAEGASADARTELERVLADVRTAEAQRAAAHFLLARLATDDDERARHHAAIVPLVPDPTAFVRTSR